MKISNKMVAFEDLPEGMIFQDPASGNVYYIKTASVVDEDTGAEEWNALNLDTYNRRALHGSACLRRGTHYPLTKPNFCSCFFSPFPMALAVVPETTANKLNGDKKNEK